ncbi:MAG: branched-chain amino acid ABC transporter permease [Hyphomicrobiaceae bacterium]
MDFFVIYQPLFDLFLISAGFALSQYIVLRAGVFSIGTVGVVAIGAYVGAILMTNYGISIWIAAPVSTLTGLVVGLLLSIPLARLRGPYQAIATLSFVQIVVSIALYAEGATGGAAGFSNIPKQVSTLGLLAAVLIVIYVLVALDRSRIGLFFDALRQDESVAGAFGVSVGFYHALAFALSGAIAGLFGALQAGYIYSIAPQQYGFGLLATTLAAVILGGRRSVAGPIIGAAIMTFLPELGRPMAENRLLVVGLLLVLVIRFMQRGIADSAISAFRRKIPSAKNSPLTRVSVKSDTVA